jgi:Fe-S-cluster-containing hydrogenase component 2
VGLIAGYHAIQAGIEVVALIEALPEVGGYSVHADKLVRLGVPLLTQHTVVAAHGKEKVETVTIAKLNGNLKIITGTEKTYAVDTVLIAVGLAEVNEFYKKAKAWKMDVFAAGDAQEIAEASAAMFTGKIEAFKIASALGRDVGKIPREWNEKAAILKAKPGRQFKVKKPDAEEGVFPVFHCVQEVPCNPCVTACPIGAIYTDKNMITGVPYRDETKACTGCLNCVAICPGLAVTLVDYRKDRDHPRVTLPFEVGSTKIAIGQMIPVMDQYGNLLGHFPVEKVKVKKKYPGTLLVQIRMDRKFAKRAVGILVQEKHRKYSTAYEKDLVPDEAVVCRCERVSAGEIKAVIRSGVRDMNQLKALTRAGMGACGSKTCGPMIWRIFLEERINPNEITDRVDRPLFVEVPMGYFAGIENDTRHE